MNKLTVAFLLLLIVTMQNSLAVAGSQEGNGGDEVGLQFASAFADAINTLRRVEPTVYAELSKHGLGDIGSRTKIVVVDNDLPANVNSHEQIGVALNDPATLTININRARWIHIGSMDFQRGLALHEMLGLLGIEKTGDYHFSSLVCTNLANLAREENQSFNRARDTYLRLEADYNTGTNIPYFRADDPRLNGAYMLSCPATMDLGFDGLPFYSNEPEPRRLGVWASYSSFGTAIPGKPFVFVDGQPFASSAAPSDEKLVRFYLVRLGTPAFQDELVQWAKSTDYRFIGSVNHDDGRTLALVYRASTETIFSKMAPNGKVISRINGVLYGWPADPATSKPVETSTYCTWEKKIALCENLPAPFRSSSRCN